MTVILSRALGPAGLGVYALAGTTIVLLSIPVASGWGTLLLKATAAGKFDDSWGETRGLMSRGAQFAFAITVLTLAVMSIILFLDRFQNLGVGRIVVIGTCCALLFDQLSALRSALLRGLDYPLEAQTPEMLVRPILLIAGFFSISWARGGSALVVDAFFALVIAAIFAAAIGQLLVRWKAPARLFGAEPIYQTGPWLAKSTPIALSAGLLSLNAYLGVLALGILTDLTEVGVYRVAVQVSLVSGLAYTSLNMIASQRFAHFRASDDIASAQYVATTMARVAAICAVPVPLLLVFAGHAFVLFAFGHEFSAALTPMVILALGQFVVAATGMAQPLLLMNGHERRVAKWTVLAVLLNFISCLLLIPSHGATGAAIASVVAAIFWNVALWLTAFRTTDVDTSILGLALWQEN